MKDLFTSIETVDKAWVYNQYDSMVQTNTTKAPGSLGCFLYPYQRERQGFGNVFRL